VSLVRLMELSQMRCKCTKANVNQLFVIGIKIALPYSPIRWAGFNKKRHKLIFGYHEFTAERIASGALL